MISKIKKLWVSALLSGKYKQAQGALKNGDGFCCLGVLCDVHRKATKKRGFDRNGDYRGEGGTLPECVAKWAGLENDSPEVSIDGKTTYLSVVNDDLEFNFKQIAKLIKEQL